MDKMISSIAKSLVSRIGSAMALGATAACWRDVPHTQPILDAAVTAPAKHGPKKAQSNARLTTPSCLASATFAGVLYGSRVLGEGAAKSRVLRYA